MSVDYSSAKATADMLSRQLADPLRPTHCNVCLGQFMLALQGDLVEHIPRLRAECHAFFDVCVAILSVRHARGELARMSRRLVDNVGRCRKHGSDRSVRVLSPDGHLHALFQSTALIFRCAVHLGERSVVDRVIRAGKVFSDSHGRWPGRVEQLFPYGVPTAIDGLLANCELYLSEGPICALGDMVDVARPLVLPVLASEPFRTRLVDVVLKMLDPAASGILERAPWLTEHNLSLQKTVYLLGSLMVGPCARPHEVDNLFEGHEDALLRAIASITESMADDDPLLPPLAIWGSTLATHPGLIAPPRVRRWLASQASVDGGHSAAHALNQIIFALATSRVCAGPTCTRSALQTVDGRPFRACAQCRTPRYCSRECQRADWKGEDGALIPHKTICRVLSRFDAQACARGELLPFVEVYERVEREFDDADRDAIRALMERVRGR